MEWEEREREGERKGKERRREERRREGYDTITLAKHGISISHFDGGGEGGKEEWMGGGRQGGREEGRKGRERRGRWTMS